MPAPRSKSSRSAKSTDNGKTVSVTFEEDRETKGTFRFKEVDDGNGKRPVMGTIWVRKDVCDTLELDGSDDEGVEVTLKKVKLSK